MVPDWGVFADQTNHTNRNVSKIPDKVCCILLWIIMISLFVVVGFAIYDRNYNETDYTTNSEISYTKTHSCNFWYCPPKETTTRKTVDIGIQTDEISPKSVKETGTQTDMDPYQEKVNGGL